MLRAVLFDLDDTLFDHERCAREALGAVHRSYDCFSSETFGEFERMHATFLEELHQRVLAGELDLDSARNERFRRLFEHAQAIGYSAEDAARVYRERYVRARRAIDGAPALLAALSGRVRIAIVSNNLLAEQQEKMKQCGLDAFVDALVVSEEVGVMKPDPVIFRVALQRVNVEPHEAVMVGDSWAADIEGARAAGIPPVWFNRGGRPRPEPSAEVYELHALEPTSQALDVIHLAHASARAHRH
jgi:2-haloalkanoic acid dehalogenase type II